MSRLGNRPIKIPNGVKVTVNAGTVNVEGPKGKLSKTFPTTIKVEVAEEQVNFTRVDDERETRAAHGMVRAVVSNMVKGVSEGFERTLVCVGVGYRAAVQGNKVNLNLGFSHPVIYDLPDGITATVADQTKLTIAGSDKELLGAVCDKIRGLRPPEPYKGKGIRYEGERIVLKEGKSAGK